jgi:acyl carrier protein
VPDLSTEILAEIRRVLTEDLEIPPAVEPGHDLRGDLQLDSIGAITLAVALEDRFRIKLSDEDSGAVATVADLVALVERKVIEDRGGASR